MRNGHDLATPIEQDQILRGLITAFAAGALPVPFPHVAGDVYSPDILHTLIEARERLAPELRTYIARTGDPVFHEAGHPMDGWNEQTQTWAPGYDQAGDQAGERNHEADAAEMRVSEGDRWEMARAEWERAYDAAPEGSLVGLCLRCGRATNGYGQCPNCDQAPANVRYFARPAR